MGWNDHIEPENIKYNDRFGDNSGWTEEEKKEATEDMLRSRFDCGQTSDYCNRCQGRCHEKHD